MSERGRTTIDSPLALFWINGSRNLHSLCHPALMSSRLLPLDRWLLGHRRGALILAAALIAFVAIAWIVIQTSGAFPGDRALISWMSDPRPAQPFDFVAHVFDELGKPKVACVTVVIVWALVYRLLGLRYAILVLAAASVIVLNTILKTILGPTPLELRTFGPAVDPNYPSGHVVYATSLCGILAWFALARGNRPLLAAMLLLILGMGPFRIVAGEHWPSDVLAGYALGIAWTTVVLVLGLRWAAGQPAGELAAGRS
jgi:membrane-associated phospholipid phosphatase